MIFKNITLIDENMVPCENMFLATRDNKIEYIGREEPKKDYGRVIDGKNRLLIPLYMFRFSCRVAFHLLRKLF